MATIGNQQQNTPEAPGFHVQAQLVNVTPKTPKADQYSSTRKPNVLSLTFEVALPAPVPPMTQAVWLASGYETYRDDRLPQPDEGGVYTRGNTLQTALMRQLEGVGKKLQATANKLGSAGKKPAHWFAPIGEDKAIAEDLVAKGVTAASCKHCNRDNPDGENCLDGDAKRQAQWDAAQPEIEAKRAELTAFLQDAYANYHAWAAAKMNLAFAASLGTGLFVVMMNQQVELRITPSDDLFQPMLGAVQNAQNLIPQAGDAPALALAMPAIETTTEANERDEAEDDEDNE